MHLWLIEVTDDELAELAGGLLAGRLHASGGGLVPYINGELYSDLLGTALDDPWPPLAQLAQLGGFFAISREAVRVGSKGWMMREGDLSV